MAIACFYIIQQHRQVHIQNHCVYDWYAELNAFAANIMIDFEIQALITNLYHAVDNYSKKEVLVQRVVFNGPSWTK